MAGILGVVAAYNKLFNHVNGSKRTFERNRSNIYVSREILNAYTVSIFHIFRSLVTFDASRIHSCREKFFIRSGISDTLLPFGLLGYFFPRATD